MPWSDVRVPTLHHRGHQKRRQREKKRRKEEKKREVWAHFSNTLISFIGDSYEDDKVQYSSVSATDRQVSLPLNRVFVALRHECNVSVFRIILRAGDIGAKRCLN